MNHELIFSLAGMLAMAGWVTLVLSPVIPVWSERIAGLAVPGILSAGYVVILFVFPAPSGGFGSFADVRELFSHADALIAGWIHFLAFDLLIGAWICRRGRQEGLPFWSVAPCLPVTFLFGPAGFLLFQLVRAGHGLAVARHP
ncbi:MAG: ABA4-like family protein [Pikeienuella sp.]|uniref:ABA4-like family protein n=1 Tax=Pikeienuella sp. TaxID=2831957 RepID=UPI00391DAB4F